MLIFRFTVLGPEQSRWRTEPKGSSTFPLAWGAVQHYRIFQAPATNPFLGLAVLRVGPDEALPLQAAAPKPS